MTVFDKLPMFANRPLYHTCETNQVNLDRLKPLAAGHPDDLASIDRFQQCWKTGLSRRKLYDTTESVGICSAMVGGLAFFPALALGTAGVLVAGGALIAGLALITASILAGQGYPNRPLPDGHDALIVMNYRQQYERGAAVALENEQNARERVEDFKKTLDAVRQGPPKDATVVREQERVVVAGVAIPVRPSPALVTSHSSQGSPPGNP